MSQQPGPMQPAPGQRLGWSVASQQEVTGADASGNYVRGVNVTFRTESGLSGTVFVPHASFTPENVRQAITQRVQLMTGVQQLQG